MRRDDLCDFCAGMGRFFYLKAERPAFWDCQPCGQTGVSRRRGPVEIPLGRSQTRFLKRLPEDKS